MGMLLAKLYLCTKSNYTTLIQLLDQYLLKVLKLLKYTKLDYGRLEVMFLFEGWELREGRS